MLNFKKFAILTANGVKRINVYNHAIFRADRWNHYWDMAIFRFSRWRLPATLNFKKFDSLMPDKVKRVNLGHRTKFYVDWWNHYWDMEIFYIFQHGSHLTLWICCVRVWTTHREHLVVYIIISWHRCSRFDNMKVYLSCLAWKCLFMLPKWIFLEYLTT